MSQRLSVADVLNYQTVTNASVNTLGIDMSKGRRVMYTVQAPSLGAAGTLDGRLQASALSNFQTITNITGTNLTQITTSTTPSNNAIATLEVRADEVAQLGQSLRYVRLQLTGGGNAITVAAVGYLGDAVQHPASQNDLNSTFLSQRQVSTV